MFYLFVFKGQAPFIHEEACEKCPVSPLPLTTQPWLKNEQGMELQSLLAIPNLCKAWHNWPLKQFSPQIMYFGNKKSKIKNKN